MFTSDIFSIPTMALQEFDNHPGYVPIDLPIDLMSPDSTPISSPINIDYTPFKYTPIFPLERDFKPIFYKVMKHLENKTPKIKRKYHFHSDLNYFGISETNWHGINLQKLCIEADNEFQAWLLLEKYLHDNATYCNGSIYRLYNYKVFKKIYEDEVKNKRGHLLTVERIVKIFIVLFKVNNTLWYSFEGENDWLFKSLDVLCDFMCKNEGDYRYMYVKAKDELFAIHL